MHLIWIIDIDRLNLGHWSSDQALTIDYSKVHHLRANFLVYFRVEFIIPKLISLLKLFILDL